MVWLSLLSPERPPLPKVPERISKTYRDLRTASVKAQYTESHNDDITALSFHPTAPHLLLSGATDALINIYNLLAPPSTTTVAATDTDDDAALHQVINHGSSIHRAGFLGTDVYALSHDEQLAMYAVVEEVPEDTERAPETAECKQWGDVRGLLGCEYVVDVMEDSSGGVVVAGSHSGHWVDLVPLRKAGAGIEGWGMLRDKGMRLHGGHGGEVVRGVWVDEGVSGVSPAPTDPDSPGLRLTGVTVDEHNLHGGRGRLGQGLAGAGGSGGSGGSGGEAGEAGEAREAHEGRAQRAQREEGSKSTAPPVLGILSVEIRYTNTSTNTNTNKMRGDSAFGSGHVLGPRWLSFEPRRSTATNSTFHPRPTPRHARFSTSTTRASERERESV